ncbi:MAG TPA: PEP-CTERM sorting domain-containing protein [Candidatus Saccharimonadales bacterium]|nr:PEP-CTERM sorting domain-containing protein [Candidatus Saccharimonadales bacterium]
MLRRILGILLVAGVLAAFAGVAGAIPLVAPAYTATYWWMGDGSTVVTPLGGPNPGNAIVAVDQVDYYVQPPDAAAYKPSGGGGGATLFLYRVTNLAYAPTAGRNGLSGFEMKIPPFHYAYVNSSSPQIPPIDPVTGNPWLAISGPDNEFMPEWEALWGFDPSLDAFGLTPGPYPGGASAPSSVSPLHTGVFGYGVDGFVGIGDVNADIHSWGSDPQLGPVPVAFRFGRVSGPVIPEPGTFLLVGIGFAGLALLRRRA